MCVRDDAGSESGNNESGEYGLEPGDHDSLHVLVDDGMSSMSVNLCVSRLRCRPDVLVSVAILR